MKRLHATLISLMILICCFSLSSCTEVARLETQAIISAIGIDKGENERFKVTAQVFQSMGSGSASPIDPSKSNTAVIFAEADTVSEAMDKIEQSLGRQINTGHTKYIVIGRELLSYPLGDILGSFSFTLYVERAAAKNRKILTATYASVAEAVRNGVFECFTTEDGYFGINSDDDLGLGAGSYSDVVDRINAELVETSINDDGYLVFETDERLGLVFGMDDEGNLIVDYREET